MRYALRARQNYLDAVKAALRRSPIVGILGPRQVGKTTLARLVAREMDHEWFDLEDPVDAQRLSVPQQVLADSRRLVVIDEIQHSPKLFELLRVLVDRPKNRTKLLILGSASPTMVKGVSESLTGRISLIDLHGFQLSEVDANRLTRLWLRGGFPRSFLARTDADSFDWRRDYLRTLMERDIPQLGITIPSATISRFWSMVAHYHGQVLNFAELARSLGSSEPTARRYLDLLTGLFMVRQLQPWFENLGKRQVKSPKAYIRDSGFLHSTLGLPAIRDLQGHPKVGASWEGFVIEQLLAIAAGWQAYFWATHSGAELDLLLVKGTRRIGFEMKYMDAPKVTPSMRISMQELKLEKLWVIYPGEKKYDLSPRVTAIGLRELLDHLHRTL